jgi:hypothetical protein
MSDSRLVPVLRSARLGDLQRLVAIQRSAELAGLGHIFPPAEYTYPTPAVQARWRAALDGADVRILLAERATEAVGLIQSRSATRSTFAPPTMPSTPRYEASARRLSTGCYPVRMVLSSATG